MIKQLTLNLGMSIAAYKCLGLDPFTVYLLNNIQDKIRGKSEYLSLWHTIQMIITEDITIMELETIYKKMLKMCADDVREDIKRAIDTISFSGV